MENNNWKTYLLSDISSKIGDGLHGTPKYDGNGDYYFINGNNLINGSIVFKEDTKKVTEDEFLKYRKDLNDNSVLISINGTIGNLSFYRNEKVVLGKSAAYINLLDTVDKKFVYYNFKSKFFQNYLVDIATGTTIPNVPLKGLREYEIQLPPLPEQKAIASVLSSLDDKIDLLHQQNQTLEALAETLFRQWFIEEAKEDWERKKIGDVLLTVLGGTPSTSKEEYWNGNIPWINSGEVNKFRILEGSKFITELGLKKSNTKLLPTGTTVLAITGATLGQISLLEIDTCANQSVVGIIPNETLSKSFVFLWVKNNINEIILNETGGAQPHINKNDINETEIIIPDRESIDYVKNNIDPLFDKISKNCFQIQTLTQLRDTILPKLMSGEVRVKV